MRRTDARTQVVEDSAGAPKAPLATAVMLWVVRGLVLALLGSPLFFWNGGVLEWDALHLIQHYLGERSALQKVLDLRATDFGNYQARELSYVFDYLDAQFFQLLLAYGMPLCIPLSGIVGSLLTVLVFNIGARKLTPGIDPITRHLILAVYLSNYVYAVTAGVFYRSTKPLLAPVLLAILFFSAYLLDLKNPQTVAQRQPRFDAASLVLFMLICSAGLLDRPGFFYALSLLGAVGLWYAVRRTGRNAFWSVLAAVSALMLYNLVLGPLILKAVNGHWPGFGYQKGQLTGLLIHPRYYLYGLEMLVQTARVLFGSFPVWMYLAVGAGLLVFTLFFSGEGRRLPTPNFSLLLACIVVASHVWMFAVMVVNHPPVYQWIDHRLWYYPLTLQTTLTFAVLVVVARLLPRLRSKGMTLIKVLLAVVIASNLASWVDYRGTMLGAPWFPAIYSQSIVLKQSLRDGMPSPRLGREYRAFYDFCVAQSPALSRQHRNRTQK